MNLIITSLSTLLLLLNIEKPQEESYCEQIQVNAPITCWSQIKMKENVSTVWCFQCQGMVGWKDDGGMGTCTQPTNPGESG